MQPQLLLVEEELMPHLHHRQHTYLQTLVVRRMLVSPRAGAVMRLVRYMQTYRRVIQGATTRDWIGFDFCFCFWEEYWLGEENPDMERLGERASSGVRACANLLPFFFCWLYPILDCRGFPVRFCRLGMFLFSNIFRFAKIPEYTEVLFYWVPS